MNINLTLIVQIIHFFIAFYIIKRFLLKPVIELVNQDEHKMILVHRDIAHSVKTFEHAESIKQQQWLEFYDFVRSHALWRVKKPSPGHGIFNVDSVPLLSSAQENVLIDEIKNSLITELADVN